MTYSEYKQLASNPPADERPSVYMLKVYRYFHYGEPEYPEFRVDETQLYFLTYTEAENCMRGLVGSERIYCFQILQLPLGVECQEEDYSRLWLFDKNGCMIDRSYASSIGRNGLYPIFRGRPKDKIRFKPGDIIEFLCGKGTVRIGVVLYQPQDYETLWSRITKHRPESEIKPETQYLDYSDDIYLVIDEDYKCWGYDMNVECTSILPLSLPLPDDMRQRLIAKYEWAAQGN